MGIEGKVSDIFDQISEGITKGFLRINALPFYLNSESRKDLLSKHTKLSQLVAYGMEGVIVGSYALNSIHDKRWLLAPVISNILSFCYNFYFSSSFSNRKIKTIK